MARFGMGGKFVKKIFGDTADVILAASEGFRLDGNALFRKGVYFVDLAGVSQFLLISRR